MSIQNAPAATSSFVCNRVQTGVPSGGEFAATLHPESPAVLSGPMNHKRVAQITTPSDLVSLAYNSAACWQSTLPDNPSIDRAVVDAALGELAGFLNKSVGAASAPEPVRDLILVEPLPAEELLPQPDSGPVTVHALA